MRLFRKKKTLPGFSHDDYGGLIFSLTKEEQCAIQDSLHLFEGHLVKKEHLTKIKNSIISQALMFYAREQVIIFNNNFNKNEKQKLIEKAIAAIGKAYYFFPLPIYLYDLASFLEMAGDMKAARETFHEFLKKQSDYKSDSISNSLLKAQGRRVKYAIKEAEEKLRN